MCSSVHKVLDGGARAPSSMTTGRRFGTSDHLTHPMANSLEAKGSRRGDKP